MALSDMQSTIADELARTDLSVQITREINNAITFYQNERLWFNENVLVTLTTISGQRTYTLQPNFAAITNVRSQVGNFLYTIEPATIQFLDNIDTGLSFVSSYLDNYALYNGQIRVYPPPVAGLPLYIRGTVILPTLTTTAATKSYAYATSFNKGDTILDQNGNIQTAQANGTTQTAPTNTYAVNTAYTVNQTVQDGNGNIQTCTTAGTSGYLLAAQPSGWAQNINGITPDGSGNLQWTLTSLQWSMDYGAITIDGSVPWKLTTALSNPWMVNAEELIRTRATRMIYQRYIKDMQQADSYKTMERDALMNLRAKNEGQTTSGRLTSHW